MSSIEDYRVISYNEDNQFSIDEEGVITLEVDGKTGYIFEQSIERIQELHDWTTRVLEAANDPLKIKRDKFAEKIYGCKYDDLYNDSSKETIDELIKID